MNLLQAAILGVVEGLTEFLPVSSTGHLVLAAHAMGKVGPAMSAFEIVIQAGALLAVVWLYRKRVLELVSGAFGGAQRGRALLINLTVAFLPAAVVGLLAHHWIEEHLFHPRPIALALIAGGVLILLVVRRLGSRTEAAPIQSIDQITVGMALWIGVAQCASLWPGTSRALATMLAALLLGASPVVAAEFSFLLALPTLGAATLYDFLKNRDALLGPDLGGPAPLLVGLAVSAIVAALAIQGFLRFVTRRGLAPFGWYRIALGVVVIAVLWGQNGSVTP